MNNQRRKQIALLVTQMRELQAAIDEIAGEERDYFDNMPESIQGGEKGMAAEEAADGLEEVAGELDDLSGRLEDIETA